MSLSGNARIIRDVNAPFNISRAVGSAVSAGREVPLEEIAFGFTVEEVRQLTNVELLVSGDVRTMRPDAKPM